MTTILRLPGGSPADLTVPALMLRNSEDHGDLPALSWRDESGARSTLTWGEARHRIAEVAAGFASLGVGSGDHVLLMMGNRPEHWLSDLALAHLGAVPVSVYGTSAREQIGHIVRHSRARLAVVEGADEVARWEPLLAGPEQGEGRLEHLVVVERDAVGAHTAWSALPCPYERAVFEKTWRGVRACDPVTVVYTSGTTGAPKGVVISHRNVVLNGLALDKVAELPDHADHLSYLPFAHIAERMLGIYLPVMRAAHVHLCPDPARIAALAQEVRPAQFFGVPRVWEKLAASVRAGLAALPEERRAAVGAAGEVARAHVRCRERGETPSAELDAAYGKAKRAVIDPLLALAGFERLVWTASASAPMSPDVVEFWTGFGLVVMDAWGLTETTGALTLNGPDAFRLGSVGRAIEGTEVRAAPDGELEVRGTTVCEGYLRADGSVERATDAEGWFATGDIGRVDEDGFVWLTDRKTEMIVTSTGKNVSPALVENALKRHPLVGQALVHGDGRSYLVALLVLDGEMAPVWAARNGIEAPPGELATHPGIRAALDLAVEEANTHLNRTEQIKRYRLLTDEWGPGSGELTPSLKLRRRVIRKRFAREIEEMYEERP